MRSDCEIFPAAVLAVDANATPGWDQVSTCVRRLGGGDGGDGGDGGWWWLMVVIGDWLVGWLVDWWISWLIDWLIG